MIYPFVTSMIVTYNEEKYIKECLESLLYQTYPSDRYEIIIIDSDSTDKTLLLAKKVEDEYKKYAYNRNFTPVKVTYLENSKKILASGWNIGIKNSIGDYVFRIDAHAYISSDFIEKNIQTIQNSEFKDKIVCVGGSMETLSASETGELIKEALSSPFGVGGSKFRYIKVSGYVDTVAYGLYPKSIFDKIGYFDEELLRTQDNDLHRRIKEHGGLFYLNPQIKSYYYSRSTIPSLLKQQFQNGKWTMINFLRRPGKMALRHFIPLIFVLSLLLCTLCSFFNDIFILMINLILISHLLCGLFFSVKRTKKISHILKMPFLFIIIHLCYGIGSISGMFYIFKK